MNYVIYGAGFRGRKLLEYIGKKHVLAFIDTDKEKQGKEYYGKSVISVEEYKKNYEFCFIIITPAFCNEIEEMLREHGIYQYSNLYEMPTEFSGYGHCPFDDCYGGLKEDYDKCLNVYGLNAFSLLIYDFLNEDKDVFICPERNVTSEKLKWVEKYYPTINLKKYSNIKSNETILITTTEQDEEKFNSNSVDLFEYANNNKNYWNEELLKFKNIFKERKKCFIVATGSSLCIDDLLKLKENNIFCFGVNSIFKIEKTWVPNAYHASDSYFIGSNRQEIEDYNCEMKFIGDSCKEYWAVEHDDSYKVHVVKSRIGTDFSEEICQKLYSGYNRGGTVTYSCLQLAVYMGFKEIYLLGVDCNYVKGSKSNHFIEEDIADYKDHGTDLMIKAYMYAKQYADNHGIKIYNATRGGMLEVFERVDFDSLFTQAQR